MLRAVCQSQRYIIYLGLLLFLSVWTLISVKLADAQTVQLSVVNGSKSPLVTPGQTVHIWANVHLPGQVFERWEGNSELLADPLAAHTTLVMPARNVELIARFKPAADWTPTEERINGSRVFSYFPQPHRGVITLYHGSGGSATSWTDGRGAPENLLFCRDAVAAGFAIVATESQNRVDKQWNSRGTNNDDVENIQTILETFKARGEMRPDAPVFAVGMSNGGGFSPLVSALLGFRATAIFCAAGYDAVIEQTQVPTIWCLAENDQIVNNSDAVTNFGVLSGRKVPAELYTNGASPVFPLRFARIEGMSEADSTEFYTRLKNNGFLDDQDFLESSPAASNWERLLGEYTPFRNGIEDELNVCRASHKFFSDFNHKVLLFFQRAATGDTESPVVSEVRTSKGKIIRKKDATVTITWRSTDNVGVESQDLAFAGDGATFTTPVASGLAGSTQSFSWSIPTNLAKTKTGRLRVLARDTAGNSGEATTDGVLIIR
ncbi:MAG TPA: hypothetical protein PL157_06335 [Acidobacteriota bacterium]|nr:hypothetical protein [Acidobacteriota bacterium]